MDAWVILNKERKFQALIFFKVVEYIFSSKKFMKWYFNLENWNYYVFWILSSLWIPRKVKKGATLSIWHVGFELLLEISRSENIQIWFWKPLSVQSSLHGLDWRVLFMVYFTRTYFSNESMILGLMGWMDMNPKNKILRFGHMKYTIVWVGLHAGQGIIIRLSFFSFLSLLSFSHFSLYNCSSRYFSLLLHCFCCLALTDAQHLLLLKPAPTCPSDVGVVRCFWIFTMDHDCWYLQ